jgi:hypothetical protein
MKLPAKPAVVAHVSDAHWEAALDAAFGKIDNGYSPWRLWIHDTPVAALLTDHARCLILLGEVPEPVDPLDVAIAAVWNDTFDCSQGPLAAMAVWNAVLNGDIEAHTEQASNALTLLREALGTTLTPDSGSKS